METLGGCIISYADSYIGQEEIKGNQGFKNEDFDTKMREMGFKNGYAWCVLFCELCWKEGYRDFAKEYLPLLDEEITAGAVRTWRHFKNLGWTSQRPKVGSIVIWQKYNNGEPTTQGHASILKEYVGDYITTTDGNTNDAGGREGYIVAEKKRKMDFNKEKGLRLLGFIHPKS